MAGEVPPLNVEILVSLGNLTNAVNEATAGLNKIGDTAKAQTSKFDALKTTMLGVFAGNLMTQGAQVLEQGLRDAIKAVEDTQVATERLSTALNNAGQNTAANRDEIQKTSETMSKLGFATAATEGAYGTLITATGSTTEATKLMAMAADLARYKHEDLATAAQTLARGTTGSAKAFKELGITLDSNLPKNEAIAKAFDELNQKIGGQAVGYTHTFAGEMEILKAKFDDVAVKVGAVVMPILTKLMEFITNVAIPAITWIVKWLFKWEIELVKLWNTNEGFRDVVVTVMKAIVEAIGYVVGAIGKLVEAASHIPIIGSQFKGVADGINGAAKSIGTFAQGLDNLVSKKAGVASLSDQLATMGSTSAGGDVGVAGQTITKTKSSTATSNTDAIIKQMDAVLVARQTKMDAATATHNDAINKAQETFNSTQESLLTKLNDSLTTAQDNYNTAVENATTTHEQNVLDIQQQYADKATQLQQTAADDRQNIIDQSIAVMTNAFAGATKIDLGKLFTAGGGSADALASQLKDQLDQITKLQQDAGQLAAAGYSQSFINEVIAQGPAQGDALAQSVLTATPATQDSIKSLYASVQDASQNGLNSLAAQMNDGTNFATQALAQQYAQVGVTLQTQLADNSAAMQTAMDKENDTFSKALTTAQTALNKATDDANAAYSVGLSNAQDTLTKSLTTAQDAFDKSVKTISDNTMKQLDALDVKLQAVAGSLAALGAMSAMGVGASASSSPYAMSSYSSMLLGPMTSSSTSSGVGSSPSSPIIGSLTQNVYTTDSSLPTVTTGITQAITLGQTQGLIAANPNKSAAISNGTGSGF